MALDQIGIYVVRNWLGRPPQVMQQTTELLEYPGSHYQAVRVMGKRSSPFVLESIVDVATELTGRDMLNDYAALVGTSVGLIRNDYNYTTEGMYVVVHHVELIELTRRVAICNSLNGGTFDLHVAWTLSYVPVS